MSIEHDPGSSFEHGVVMGLASPETLEVLAERIADTRFYADKLRRRTGVTGYGPAFGRYNQVELMVDEAFVCSGPAQRKIDLAWVLYEDEPPVTHTQAIGIKGELKMKDDEIVDVWQWHANEGFPTNQANLLVSMLATEEGMPAAHAVAARMLLNAMKAESRQDVAIPKELVITEDEEQGDKWRKLNDVLDKEHADSTVAYELSVDLEGGKHTIEAFDSVKGRDGHFSDGFSQLSWVSVSTPELLYEYTSIRTEYEDINPEEIDANPEINTYVEVTHTFSLPGANGEPEHAAIGELTEMQAWDVIRALQRIVDHRAEELDVTPL